MTENDHIMDHSMRPIELDKESTTPLYQQIVEQVKAYLAEGSLHIGDQLPPGRELAATLGVHRTTVINAYAELQSEGIIDSHVGRGTFVAAVPETPVSRTPRPSFTPMVWDSMFVTDPSQDRLHKLIDLQSRKDVISFACALPSPELFPLEDIRTCVNRVLRKEGQALLQIGDSFGYDPLREHLIGGLSHHGIQASMDEVLITNGCQQSLDLIRKILVQPGDTVLIENPTYPGALNVFSTRDVRCIGIPVGAEGIDLAALEHVLVHNQPKLLYTIPTFHNPTGSTLDLAGRRRLLQLASLYRVPVVEDDIYGELRYEGSPLPSLKALDDRGIVIYLNSVSKIGFPGMRVGWVVAHRAVIDRLRIARQSQDFHTNLISQAALCELSSSGLLTRHLKRVRKVYAERRNRLLSALERYFPEGTRWSRPAGGMNVWITLPRSIHASSILSEAAQLGVLFTPGEMFYGNSPQLNTMRLPFSMLDSARMEEGVKRIARVLKKHMSQTPAGPEPEKRAVLV